LTSQLATVSTAMKTDVGR